MEYKIENIDGLDVMLVDMPSSKTTSIQFFVRAGSIFEENNFSNGTAHFLEHMIFKGGKKYNSQKKVSQEVEKFGGYFNAFTGKKSVRYYIDCPNENTKKSLEILSDVILNPRLNEKEFEIEKGVIHQELREGNDETSVQYYDEFSKFYYGENFYSANILGTEKSIQNMKISELKEFYEKYYNRQNSCLIVVGKLEKNILKIIEKFFKLKKGKSFDFPKYNFDDYIFNKKKRSGLSDKGNSQTTFGVYFPGENFLKNGTLNPDYFALSLATIAFGGLSSSRVYIALREKMGLCYYAGASHFEGQANDRTLEISGGLEHKKLEKAIRKIEKMIKNFDKKPLLKKEFEIAKSYKIGRLKLGFDTASQIASSYGYEWIEDKEINKLEDLIKNYQKVDLEQANKIFLKTTNISPAIFYLQ